MADEKIQIICAKCGSDDVMKDAWAEWSVETQNWILHSVYDNTWCEKCEENCKVIEITI
ncbi:MAG: hypothetical protein H8E51_07080 [Bacteroidetes bacterium]|nr:hypothetical protein [Bacteroidota bacterium]